MNPRGTSSKRGSRAHVVDVASPASFGARAAAQYKAHRIRFTIDMVVLVIVLLNFLCFIFLIIKGPAFLAILAACAAYTYLLRPLMR